MTRLSLGSVKNGSKETMNLSVNPRREPIDV
jgi:hypothetical protein